MVCFVWSISKTKIVIRSGEQRDLLGVLVINVPYVLVINVS